MTQKLRVLMIDDDEAACELIGRFLCDAEGVLFSFEYVLTADAGLNRLIRGEHDVYLIDYRIGPADGLELVRRVTAEGVDAAIVMLTCHGSRQLDLMAMEAGAELFLEKERMDPTLLERSIRLVIERHRMRRSLAHRAQELEAANDELRQVEQRLRRSEQRLKAFTRALPDLATVFDDHGHCLEMLTTSQEVDWISHRRLHDFLPHETAETCLELIRLAAESGKTQTFEFPYEHEGRKKWFEARASRMEDDPGEARCVACVLRDITHRMETRQTLDEKTKELQRSNAELQQFAYVASHDLREPLRMIAGYTSLIEKRSADSLDQENKKFMSYVLEGVARMQTLIDDLLAYSRVGTAQKGTAKTSSGSALGRAMEYLRPAIEEAGATFCYKDLPEVWADAGQLTQLFQNLVGNALKFRNSQPPRIEIGADAKADDWVFWIRDNGIGLDKKHAERIFVIFQRLHGRERYPGTGIGLAICKRIVERHGGTIWVESEIDKGATFFFTVPRTIDSQFEGPAPKAGAA